MWSMKPYRKWVMDVSEMRVSKPCCKGRWVIDPGFTWRLFIQRFEQTPFSGFLVHRIGAYWKERGHQFLSYTVPEISAAKGEREEGGGQGMAWCYSFDIDGCSPWPHFRCPVTAEDLITHHGPGSDISPDVSKLAISLCILSACQRAVYFSWPMWSPLWAAHFRDRYLVVQPRNPGTFFHASSSILLAWIY